MDLRQKAGKLPNFWCFLEAKQSFLSIEISRHKKIFGMILMMSVLHCPVLVG
jgi:hypothetical protein